MKVFCPECGAQLEVNEFTPDGLLCTQCGKRFQPPMASAMASSPAAAPLASAGQAPSSTGAAPIGSGSSAPVSAPVATPMYSPPASALPPPPAAPPFPGLTPAAAVPRPQSRVVTYVLLAILLFVFGPCCFGIIAAIAIPNFMKYQARAKQAECKSNLKSIYVAERAYFEQHDKYSTRVNEVGFSPERKNRYAYFISVNGTVEDRSKATATSLVSDSAVGVDTHAYPSLSEITAKQVPTKLAGGVEVGVSGECPKCFITAVCVGNLDKDPALDIWSISTQERKGPNGEPIEAGTPFQESDDVLDLGQAPSSGGQASDEEDDDSQEISSKDGLTALMVPADWTERKDLNKAATIQASGPDDAYVIVISEKREDFADGLDLRGYAKLTTTQFMKRLHGDPKKTVIKDLEISGYPAIQFEVMGEADSLKIRYLHTVVQTESHFHRIIAWAKASKFERNRALFEEIAEGFEEREKP